MKNLVIIPTYNEKENIEAIIRAVMNLPVVFHVLVVDDGSPDGTGLIIQNLQLKEFHDRLFLEERKGKLGLGTAYIHGFQWAIARAYDYIFEMDADFSHNPKDLVRLLQACTEEGYEVAIGSRYVQGVNVINWPMSRVLMSYFAGIYVRFITRMPFMDPTGGFMCYKREVLETIPLKQIQFVGYAFQIEMKFNAYLYKFKMKEVPIVFTDRTHGHSKMSTKIFKEALFGVVMMKIWSIFKTFKR